MGKYDKEFLKKLGIGEQHLLRAENFVSDGADHAERLKLLNELSGGMQMTLNEIDIDFFDGVDETVDETFGPNDPRAIADYLLDACLYQAEETDGDEPAEHKRTESDSEHSEQAQ